MWIVLVTQGSKPVAVHTMETPLDAFNASRIVEYWGYRETALYAEWLWVSDVRAFIDRML
jgi:hypothetical protein